jgi:site-specific recombinase XerD
VVDGELVEDGPGRAVAARRPWQTQAERDLVIENAAEVFERIGGRLSANTRKSYGLAWGKFVRWCMDRKRTPYPLNRETLLSYLGYMARQYDGRGASASAVEVFLAAARRVCLFYADPGDTQGWVGAHIEIADWVAKYREERNRNPATRPKRSAGARQVMMRAMLDVLPDTASGIRDRALMLFGYYMAARRSELVNLTHDDVRLTVDGLEAYIAWSKTDQEGEGVWVAVPSNDRHSEYDPFTAWQAWLSACRAQGVTGGPLFRAVDRHGNIRARGGMDGQAVEGLVARARMAAYLKARATYEKHPRSPEGKSAAVLMSLLDPDKVKITPHSLRRGWATDARAAGWDLLEIARGGRWSPTSGVLHIYVEEVERWLRHQHNPMPL